MENQAYKNKIAYLNEIENKQNSENPNYIYYRNEVTYFNPSSGKQQMQSYLHMNDLIVPILLKIDNRGTLYFAMQYTYISACNKIFLELPSYKMEKDFDLTLNSISKIINYNIINCKDLSSFFSPVSQSITDQMAKFVEIEVEYEEKKELLQWYPINCLDDLLKKQDINMSLQTKYGLMLFKEKYKNELKKIIPKEFKENKRLLRKKFNPKQKYLKKIYDIYRFGVVEKYKTDKKVLKLHNKNIIQYFGDKTIYATSKNSVQCILTKIENGKVKIGLSKQQRSPFVAREEVDEYLYEAPAGLVEDGELFDLAAKREAFEETGIQINGKMIKLCNKLLLSYATEEMIEFYLTELEENYVQTKQKLDEQENISEIEWFDLKNLDVNKIHSPLTTKISVLFAKEFYNY